MLLTLSGHFDSLVAFEETPYRTDRQHSGYIDRYSNIVSFARKINLYEPFMKNWD
jgi:hypothetical protein